MLRNDEQDAALIELNGSNAAATPGRARGAQSAACPTWRRATTRGGEERMGKERRARRRTTIARREEENFFKSRPGSQKSRFSLQYLSSLNLILYIRYIYIYIPGRITD